ncbi:MAG: ATP-binding protein [Kineosporiaceae bacterium]
MRRRLTVLVAAITSAAVVALLVPLGLLLRTLAEERAIVAAMSQSQALLAVAESAVSTKDGQSLKDQIAVVTTATNGLLGKRSAGTLSFYYRARQGPIVAVSGSSDPRLEQVIGSDGSWTYRGTPTVVYNTAVLGDGLTFVARAEVGDDLLHQGAARSTAIVAGLALVVLLVAIFAADRLAKRITAPLYDLAAAADRMRQGPVEEHVPEQGPREVVALARALNRLAGRVRQLLASERDAVADLSHRLRTPVTALRLDTEFVDDPEVAERLRGHVTQLERTVDAIVHDARRPSRSDDVSTSCDVGRVVAERVAFWSALAEDQGRPLRLALPDRPLRARLDAADLADVVDVLIDNVFEHTDDGTPVEIWVVPRADGAVVLTVEDAGPGLPSIDVINRGKSNKGSTGLGLDIVRRAALASGGSLELGRSRLGGALVRLVLGRAAR